MSKITIPTPDQAKELADKVRVSRLEDYYNECASKIVAVITCRFSVAQIMVHLSPSQLSDIYDSIYVKDVMDRLKFDFTLHGWYISQHDRDYVVIRPFTDTEV